MKKKEKNKGRYKILDEENYYKVGRGRGVIGISESEETGNKTLSFRKEVKTKENKWTVRRGNFFIISFRWIDKVIDILLKFARKFEWKIPSIERPEIKLGELKRQYDQALRKVTELEDIKEKLEINLRSSIEEIEKYKSIIIKKNFETFKKDVEDFESLLRESETENIKEEEIQQFLKHRPWIFSLEYYSVTPKKPVGSKNIFDFYLEDYKGQGTVVELKKPSEELFSTKEEYGLSTKCGIALGQLIRYIEDTISYSQVDRVSKIERISEIKPLGFLIIGRIRSKNELERLKILNSYFHMIQILSYDTLLSRAKKFIESWTKQNKEVN